MGLKARFFFQLVILLLLFHASVLAQEHDSLAKSNKHFTIKPTTDFDQRFSFFQNSKVNIWGQKVGVLLNNRWKVGIGGYFLNDRLKESKLTTASVPDYYVKRNLRFGTLYFEPFLFRKSWWELSVPFEAGIGKTNLRYFNSVTNMLEKTEYNFFFPTGLGLSLSLKLPPGERFKPFRWVGINFLAGYRYDLDEHVFNTDYDGAFWSISGAIFLDRILDDYRGWRKKHHAKA